MTLPIVICDDSALARKQLARSLPGGWDVSISFASNGQEALEAIRQGKGDLLFLDLNMPVMDGYQTLEAIRREDLSTLVLVVSGDIQPEARQRVMALGALDFIRKPFGADTLTDILLRFGIISSSQPQTEIELARFDDQPVDLPGLIQEVVNIAMGQAGKLLGELLGTFIHLPVPRVHLQPYPRLANLITTRPDADYSGVSQGFSGSGITGEALILIDTTSLPTLARLLPETQQPDSNSELEILTDLAGLLAGACLKGFAEQLDIQFSLGHPTLLGRNTSLQQLLGSNQQKQVLAIDLDYQLPEKKIECDLLLVFTEDSLPALTERTGYLQ
ncbi:response regulator [Marinospirillum alkaliphilum]|uniref:Response regulator containing CheY-like receiver domain and AraC-type DNA-binding domain n=1 Tax=Marinospirillum alkaliphilum DSM 21637 TaxID=1122209 RepID=A0A1K1U312_9GAMM|nr:response regulator [Marinospirillum alkaliphilum]SFX07136.1 Response regulator containing CheY-like receiver domain and AraC-type DNA-binding domain [Marinospirillum alkaliphilum DSM 21637]